MIISANFEMAYERIIIKALHMALVSVVFGHEGLSREEWATRNEINVLNLFDLEIIILHREGYRCH